jgi:hypothetical protein
MTVSAADQRYTPVLNESLGIFFGDAVKATLRDPTQAAFFLRTVRWQKRARPARDCMSRRSCCSALRTSATFIAGAATTKHCGGRRGRN